MYVPCWDSVYAIRVKLLTGFNKTTLKFQTLQFLTSSTFPVVLSFQQKWMSESSDCWMYTVPLRLSGVTTLPFRVILPARNSTRYLLELPLEPLTMLGKRAPDDITKSPFYC